MNAGKREDWKFEVISQILFALAENENIKENLIFKGALILNQYLSSPRKSLDIDSNLTSAFIKSYPRLEQQKSFLKINIEQAISRHFEKQDPVRFELKNLKIEHMPRTSHPHGWDGFYITVSISDHENSGVRGLPNLTIDVVAPETLSEYSLTKMRLGKSKIVAYTLERIAGEKARAFLSSLRTYKDKIGKREKAIRVRDLYDLAQIVRVRKLSDNTFWKIAGNEFKLSCESRFVDCVGVSSFREEWTLAEELYKKSPTIPKDIPFKEVETFIINISKYWEKTGIIPFSFPLSILE
ncbi:MAG: nucleotidyl transferase AbiEii/AbiGii toxin family protein [Candidatus Aminicenantales bacterium]